MRVTAIRCVILGASRYWDRVETANAMSGRVITAVYIKEPIISLYLVFSVGMRSVSDTVGESKLRLIPGSMGVMVVQAF